MLVVAFHHLRLIFNEVSASRVLGLIKHGGILPLDISSR